MKCLHMESKECQPEGCKADCYKAQPCINCKDKAPRCMKTCKTLTLIKMEAEWEMDLAIRALGQNY